MAHKPTRGRDGDAARGIGERRRDTSGRGADDRRWNIDHHRRHGGLSRAAARAAEERNYNVIQNWGQTKN